MDEGESWDTITNDYSAEERFSQEERKRMDQKPKISVAEKVEQGQLESREILFLQSQANIIEKTLGDGEIMKIRPECLIAFSPTV